jgi:hypothetical protein
LEGITLFKKSLLMLVSVLLVSVIAFSAFTPAFASDGVGDIETDMPKVAGIELPMSEVKELDRNWYSFSIFRDLIDCFPKITVMGEYGLTEAVAYPSDYAGAYIDGADNLHILLTNDVDDASEYDYRAIVGYDEDVVFEVAEYSYSFLRDVQHTVDGVMFDFNIGNTGVNVKTNRLEVGLVDRTMDGAVVEFLQTKFGGFDNSCVVFGDATPIGLTASNAADNALSGSTLNMGANPNPTLGFNAVRNGRFGVVTAGHVATAGTTINNALGTAIGAATAGDTRFNGIDAAFVEFANQTFMQESYRLVGTHSSDILTNYYPSDYYLVGLNTRKSGSVTGFTTGTVLAIDVSFPDSGSQFTHQVHISNQQLVGDSGGIVYSEYTALQTTLVPPKTILGIATFRNLTDNTAYVSPVWDIMSAFGIEPYVYPLQYSYVQGVVGAASHYGSGRVDDHSDLKGKFPDGKSARILGIWVNGDGGNIVGYLNKVSTGTVAIFARSVTSSTKIHVYTSSSSSGPWTEITSNKWVSQNSNMDWIVCGSRGVGFEYIAISAMQEDNKPANIYIDTVIVY